MLHELSLRTSAKLRVSNLFLTEFSIAALPRWVFRG
jgi:hypothetical protein